MTAYKNVSHILSPFYYEDVSYFKEKWPRDFQCASCVKEQDRCYCDCTLIQHGPTWQTKCSHVIPSQCHKSPVATVLLTQISKEETERWVDRLQVTQPVSGTAGHLASPGLFLLSSLLWTIQKRLSLCSLIPCPPLCFHFRILKSTELTREVPPRLGASSYSGHGSVGRADIGKCVHPLLPFNVGAIKEHKALRCSSGSLRIPLNQLFSMCFSYDTFKSLYTMQKLFYIENIFRIWDGVI